MFYKTQIKDHIRVAPKFFGNAVNDAVIKAVREKYSGFIDEEIGFVIDVLDVQDVGEGVIIPGDGAAYYETTFELITFKPEMHEIIPGRIKDIADFGAFITMGPIDGMIHVSQTMDDYVTFAKDKVLTGRDSKRFLKVGDECRARVIAISFKDALNPKIGLTMRQAGLGKMEWIAAESVAPVKAAEPEAKKEDKKSKKEKK